MEKIEEQIVNWLRDYATNAKMQGFVIGVSGGVDSAVVSTLCAKTGMKTYVMQLPIRQHKDHVSRATKHIEWLVGKYPNVVNINVDLTIAFETLLNNFTQFSNDSEKQHAAEANSRSRLRMVTLYYHASIYNCLVVGTGNKIEDFGVKFFSKFGDGGVDLSPIGDLMKSEVRKLAKHIEVCDEIINCLPTDGLWDDGRGDEDQIKASYEELEWAMKHVENNPRGFAYSPDDLSALSERQQEVLRIYKNKYFEGEHKMHMPPVCVIKRSCSCGCNHE